MITEKQLHKQICTYIKAQYPMVLFNTDMSGVKLTIGQAKQAKKLRSGNGFPDIVIYQKCLDNINKYIEYDFNALFLEVKKETPYKKNGELKAGEHLAEQVFMHQRLSLLGYRVEFVWTFEMAKEIIDNYLNNRY